MRVCLSTLVEIRNRVEAGVRQATVKELSTSSADEIAARAHRMAGWRGLKVRYLHVYNLEIRLPLFRNCPLHHRPATSLQ